MNLRWHTYDNEDVPPYGPGRRVLQMETMYGWEDIPETSEAEERQQRQRWAEEHAHHEQELLKKMMRDSLPYHQRRAFDDFV